MFKWINFIFILNYQVESYCVILGEFEESTLPRLIFTRTDHYDFQKNLAIPSFANGEYKDELKIIKLMIYTNNRD